MNNYVTSLQLSKELYEKGIVKDAESWWIKDKRKNMVGPRCFIMITKPICPAPIAEELLELLSGMKIEKYWLSREPGFKEELQYKVRTKNQSFYDEKLNNALASLLLYLHKEGYLDE